MGTWGMPDPQQKKQGETHAWPCQFLFLLFNLQKNFFTSEKISFFSYRGLGPGWLLVRRLIGVWALGDYTSSSAYRIAIGVKSAADGHRAA